MPQQAQPPSFFRRVATVTEEIFNEWSRDNVPRLAASLAYYTILSSAPLLVMSVGLASRVFGQKAAQGQLAYEIQTLVGGEAARAIQAAVRGAHQTDAGLAATLLSIIPLVIGASSVVVELHDALNTIWDVKEPEAGSLLNSILRFIKQRLYLTLVVIAAGCLLLISLLLSIFIATLGRFFTALLPTPEWVLHLAAFAASFIVVTLLFGAIYKLLPDIRLRWSDVFIGASVTSLLFTIGKQLIAIYLGRVGFESTYGAVWAAVILLIWVYYSAQMFFLGAEFTKVYARSFGSHIKVPAIPPHSETNKFS